MIAFDAEWQNGNGPRQNPLPGFVAVHQPGDLKRVLSSRLGASFKVLYQPEQSPEQHFDAVCELAIAAEDLTLAIDEAADYTTSNYVPEQLGRIIRKGRHYGVSMVWNSQQPSDVSPKLINVSGIFAVFRLESPRYLSWCRDRGMPDELVREVPRLPKRNFYLKNSAGDWVPVGE